MQYQSPWINRMSPFICNINIPIQLISSIHQRKFDECQDVLTRSAARGFPMQLETELDDVGYPKLRMTMASQNWNHTAPHSPNSYFTHVWTASLDGKTGRTWGRNTGIRDKMWNLRPTNTVSARPP